MITQKRYKRIPELQRIKNFVDASIECGYAGRDYLTRKETYYVCDTTGLVYPRWLAKNPDRRIGRGKFSFPELKEAGSGTVKQVKAQYDKVLDEQQVHADNHIANEEADKNEELVSIPVMTSNAIPTITSEDMIALSNL